MKKGVAFLAELFAAFAFYTCIPIPVRWARDFRGVARLAPLVGMGIGGLLGVLDQILWLIHMPILTRSAFVVAVWVALTGGLHLDGAMDTADGLAVNEPSRRLEVMTDSATGAFGAMVAVILLLLKTTTLADLPDQRWLMLIVVAGWGRWGQQVAIARYPYLKPTGKGAFHKAAIRSIWNTIPSLFLLLGLSAMPILVFPSQSFLSLGLGMGGAIALITAAWFNRQLGGHTGDTYGAVVEWTEALLLVTLTVFKG